MVLNQSVIFASKPNKRELHHKKSAEKPSKSRIKKNFYED